MPLISIIIPTFNSRNVLSASLDSILNQRFTDYEVLILDGNSIDNTVELVKSFKDLRLHVHTEADQGVYDAMNKGILKARGNWLLFLGSDDRLYDENVLFKVSSFLMKTSKQVVYGDAEIDGEVSWAKGEKVYGGKFSLYRLLRRNICHQAIFYKRDFLINNNLTYNLSFPVSADWDLNLRAWLIQPFQYYSGIISSFTAGGISSGGRDDGFQQAIPSLYSKYYNNPYANPFTRLLFGVYKKVGK